MTIENFANVCERNCRGLIVKLFELVDKINGNQIWASGKQLTQFYKGWP